MSKYYQNELKFKINYSKNYLPKINNWAYIINLSDYKSNGTHWMPLYVNGDNVSYDDSFVVEYLPTEI